MPYAAPRVSLILAVERAALYARYGITAVLLPLFFAGYIPGDARDAIMMAAVVLLHNVYVHWVFAKKRYNLLFGPLNFCLHLAEVSFLVFVSGAESTAAYPLFILFIIGYSAHARAFGRIVGVSALTCLIYAIIVVVEWYLAGLLLPLGVILAKLVIIMTGGWLIAVVSERLRLTEDEHLAQAQELASSEATLRTILDSAADPILVFNEKELITEANGRACSLLGLPREQLVGTRIRSYIFDDGTLPSKFATLRNRGEYRGEQLLIDASGEEHTTDMVVRSFMREQRRYFVLVARDISEERQLQEATRQANINLERLNQELSHVHNLKAQFLTSMSRKLRSPLAVILGYFEILLEGSLGELTEEQRKALLACRRSAMQVLSLVDEALELSQQTAPAATDGDQD